jgi:aerobic-type carbon monoxide dehydrogenase small subunit (CoxS/CutS family)
MAAEREEGGKLSRRGFLKGMGGGILGGAVVAEGLLKGEAGAAKGDAEVVRGRTRITLKVNGQARQVEVEPRTTLLSALRNRLDMTGTKEVCDRGQCGACTVLLDGKAVLACMMLALEARGREITTVEGLAQGGELSAVQQAFVEEDGQMCGFCTPGMVMAATVLLKEKPHPTLEEIRAGVSGNVCRCGTYPKVFAAVQSAAQKIGKGG